MVQTLLRNHHYEEASIIQWRAQLQDICEKYILKPIRLSRIMSQTKDLTSRFDILESFSVLEARSLSHCQCISLLLRYFFSESYKCQLLTLIKSNNWINVWHSHNHEPVFIELFKWNHKKHSRLSCSAHSGTELRISNRTLLWIEKKRYWNASGIWQYKFHELSIFRKFFTLCIFL